MAAKGVLDEGTREARIGRGVGEMVGGSLAVFGGLTGGAASFVASVTGVGTVPGAVGVAISASVVTGGVANMTAGMVGLLDALSTGSGPGSTEEPAAAPTPVAKPVHGNNLNTNRPAQGYTLRDRQTEEVLKYGETTLGKNRYTQSYLDKHNARMVPETIGTKAEMHKWQHEKILEYKATHGGKRPPLNKSDW